MDQGIVVAGLDPRADGGIAARDPREPERFELGWRLGRQLRREKISTKHVDDRLRVGIRDVALG
jgi:hypothetical protein